MVIFLESQDPRDSPNFGAYLSIKPLPLPNSDGSYYIGRPGSNLHCHVQDKYVRTQGLHFS